MGLASGMVRSRLVVRTVIAGTMAAVLGLVALVAPASAAPGDVDLDVTQSARAVSFAVGEPLFLDIQVVNRGATAVRSALTSSVPAALTVVDADGMDVDCAVVGQEVTCDLGTMQPSGSLQTRRITIETRPNAAGDVSSTATATSAGDEPVPDLHPNSATTTVDIAAGQVQLGLDVSGLDGTWHLGRSGLVDVGFVNSGDATATNVRMTYTVPPEFRIDSASIPRSTGPPSPCPISGRVISCPSAAPFTLGPQDGFPVRVFLTPIAPTTGATHLLSVTSDQPEPQSDPGPNQVSVTTPVSDVVDLSLEGTAVTPGPGPVVGVPFTYRWAVRDHRPAFASTATVVQTVPAGFTIGAVRFFRSLPPGSGEADIEGSCGAVGQTVTCAAAPPGIPADDKIATNATQWALEVTVTPTVAGPATSEARISSPHPEPVPDPFPNFDAVEVNVTSADRTSRLEGSVVGPVGPATWVEVSAYRVTDSFVATGGVTTTGGGGGFSFPSLPPGDYQLKFVPRADSGLTTQWGGGASTRADAAVITVDGQGGLVDVGVETLSAEARMRGVITGPGGVPVSGAKVSLYLSDQAWVARYSTTSGGAGGTYDLRGVTPGRYQLKIEPPSASRLASEWWDDSGTRAGATVIDVPAGANYLGVDAELPATGSIEGTARNASNDPVVGMRVRFYGPTDVGSPSYEAVTTTSGSYFIGGLKVQDYDVEFVPPEGSGLSRLWYHYSATRSGATKVSVTDSTPVKGVDVSWVSRLVGGRVLGPTGAPLAGVTVMAYGPSDTWVGSTQAVTRADGTYTLTSVGYRDYQVRFVPPAGSGLSPQWYDGAATRSGATPVSVTRSGPVTDINASWASRGMSGRVTGSTGAPLGGVRVVLYGPDDTWVGSREAVTGADGTYTLDGLVAQDYRVRFVPPAGSGLPALWYLGSATRAGATVVTVRPSGTVTGIDATWASRTVLGRVSGATGAPLWGVRVVLYGPTDTYVGSHEAVTAADGTYRISGLAVQDYRVRFVPPEGSGLSPLWYLGSATRGGATVVAVSPSGPVTGIDATWAPG